MRIVGGACWRPCHDVDGAIRTVRGASRRPLHVFLSLIFILPICFVWADPTAASRYVQGLAYERLGRLDEAYTELQLASVLDAKNPQMALALGIVASRLGRYDEALRAAENSIALDANSCASYYLLAFLYEKKNRNDRALESWHRFLGLSQDEPLKTLARKHITYLESNAR